MSDRRDDAPTDLPDAKAKIAPRSAKEAARICEKCQSTSVRVWSDAYGQHAQCGHCKHFWGISMAASMIIPSQAFERGLSKQTIVEPDWNLAFEPDIDEPDPEPGEER